MRSLRPICLTYKDDLAPDPQQLDRVLAGLALDPPAQLQEGVEQTERACSIGGKAWLWAPSGLKAEYGRRPTLAFSGQVARAHLGPLLHGDAARLPR